jgi:hypothetical protein
MHSAAGQGGHCGEGANAGGASDSHENGWVDVFEQRFVEEIARPI